MRNFLAPFLFLVFVSSFLPVSIYAQSGNKYTNPIIAGFYPGTSICRVDSNYYPVNSTFAYFSGMQMKILT